MNPREYMRACGVPDDVEVATSVHWVGSIVLGDEGASIENESHFTTVASVPDLINDRGQLTVTSGRLALIHDEADAIAWIARKR